MRHARLATTGLALVAALVALGASRVAATASASGAPRQGSTPATASARPGGLVQVGDSKTACIYVDLGAPLQAAEQATGVNYRCLMAFVTGSSTWAEWEKPWIVQPQFGYLGWLSAAPSARTLVITTNLVPNTVARYPNWRAAGAAGRYDTYARRLAANLVAAGLGNSVIRLGPEMNGPWEVDWIGTTTLQHEQWARSFAHMVSAMRSVRGAHFLFDWTVNAGYQDIPLLQYYPGNAYVNLVGVDAYDEAPIKLPPVGSPARWTVLVHEPLGLLQIYAFARQHHKPLSIPEWGTLSTYGDDGPYVQAMGAFIATHDVAYQAWYDVGDNHILELQAIQAPRSLAAYRSQFRRAHATIAASPSSSGTLGPQPSIRAASRVASTTSSTYVTSRT